MQAALNELLALKLIDKQDEKYLVPEPRYREFDAFRKKRRKDRFDTVAMYFRNLSDVTQAPQTIKMTDKEYMAHVKEYRSTFREAMRKVEK